MAKGFSNKGPRANTKKRAKKKITRRGTKGRVKRSNSPEHPQLAAFRQVLKDEGLFDVDSDYGGEIGHAVMRCCEAVHGHGMSGAGVEITTEIFQRLVCTGQIRESLQRGPQPPTFEDELRELINRHSKESGSNTPDDILASFLSKCLTALDEATQTRDRRTAPPDPAHGVGPAPQDANGGSWINGLSVRPNPLRAM